MLSYKARQFRKAVSNDYRRYKIIRFYQNHPSKVIAIDLTLEEAKAYCNDPETSSSTATNPEALAHKQKYGPWFDGYEEMKNDR